MLHIGSGNHVSICTLENIGRSTPQDVRKQSGLKPVSEKVPANGEAFRQDLHSLNAAAPGTGGDHGGTGSSFVDNDPIWGQLHMADGLLLKDLDAPGVTRGDKTLHDMPRVDKCIIRIENTTVCPDLGSDPERVPLLIRAPGKSLRVPARMFKSTAEAKVDLRSTLHRKIAHEGWIDAEAIDGISCQR
jgi:hypothetical protein